jgi:enoyl-CoA hydratase
MEYEHIIYTEERGRATITLNRPEKLNAISRRMPTELNDAFWRADESNGVHCVVLRGEGRSFCSGFDLGGAGDSGTGRGPGEGSRPVRGRRELDDDAWQLERTNRLLMAPFDMHKPVIAQVHGHCLAGGTMLALVCDLVIVADDARIGFPPARDLGALPISLWLYHVGPQWSKRLLLTGDTITGKEAAQLGFALKSVPAADLAAEVDGLADRLTQIDHHLLSANKREVNLGLELMGARTLQRITAEIDAHAHNAPAARGFGPRVAELGLREALRTRDAVFGDGRARVNGPERRDEHGRLIDTD